MRGTVGREGYRVEMIFGGRTNLNPSLSGVFRKHHRAARSDRHSAFRILHIESIEIHDYSRTLAFPLKAAVGGVKHHSVCAYAPTVSLVSRETDRADGAALRSRVLPLPSTVDLLPESRSDAANRCASKHC